MKKDLLRVVAGLSNRDLLDGLRLIVVREFESTAEIVAHLAEVESRSLHLARGFPSLFLYCVRVLHFSEHAAYLRIQAARVTRRFPDVLDRLGRGEINLTTVNLLGPLLTRENHAALLDEATHRTRRQVEEMVARLRPRDPAPTVIRRLPDRGRHGGGTVTFARGPELGSPSFGDGDANRSDDGPRDGRSGGGAFANVHDDASRMAAESAEAFGPHGAPVDESLPDGTKMPRRDEDPAPPVTPRRLPSETKPLAPGLYRIQFTAGAGTYQKLLRAQELLRHVIPDGDPAQIFDRALTVLVGGLEQRLCAETTRPRPKSRGGSGGRNPMRSSRTVPIKVRRIVWKRDGGGCAFRTPDGRRCGSKDWLEFHHVRAFARGGPATPENIELRCRAHNQYEAELEFGPRRQSGTRGKPPGPEGRNSEAARRNGNGRRTGSDRPDAGGGSKSEDSRSGGSGGRSPT